MSKCEWFFLNKDGTSSSAVLDGEVPAPGDGKVHEGRGYAVAAIVGGRTTSPHDAVIAKEHD